MKKLLSLLLIFSFSAQANEVVYLKKGEPAPFTGYFFDLEAEQNNRLELLKKDQLEKQVSLFRENEKLWEINSERWQKVAMENTERLVKVERYTFWQNALFFGLGVVVTGGLAIGLSKGLNN